MAKTSHDPWNPHFIDQSPLFFPLRTQESWLARKPPHWPDFEDYQALLDQQTQPPCSLSGAPIRFVPQADKPQRWQEDYEPRIYLKGEVQTRLHNWHDFFQVLVWVTFPHTKAVLNAKHYEAIKQRKASAPDSKSRTPLENALTQFDECGAIVVSCDNELLQLIREFRWKDLFWNQRAALRDRLQCFVFGHAIYEKVIQPYIGLTAHAVLYTVDREFFQWSVEQQCRHLDGLATKDFSGDRYANPRQFQPFPVLGMPDWHDNQSESYYDNQNYFRTGRNLAKSL